MQEAVHRQGHAGDEERRARPEVRVAVPGSLLGLLPGGVARRFRHAVLKIAREARRSDSQNRTRRDEDLQPSHGVSFFLFVAGPHPRDILYFVAGPHPRDLYLAAFGRSAMFHQCAHGLRSAIIGDWVFRLPADPTGRAKVGQSGKCVIFAFVTMSPCRRTRGLRAGRLRPRSSRSRAVWRSPQSRSDRGSRARAAMPDSTSSSSPSTRCGRIMSAAMGMPRRRRRRSTPSRPAASGSRRRPRRRR